MKHPTKKSKKPMSQRMLKALQGSIKKWEKIVDGTGEDRRDRNCPLCKLYADNGCVSCPITADTEENRYGCNNTPWKNWTTHHRVHHTQIICVHIMKGCNECKELAQAELDFLKSLLPEGEKYKCRKYR